VHRVLACVAVLAGVLACGACTSDDEPENALSVDAVRQAAGDAGTSPENCPLDIDVPAALRSAGVDGSARLDSATAEVSERDEPADDPLAAQQQGMAPLDAAAGANIECHYLVGDEELDVQLVVTRSEGAVNMLAPQIVADAGMAMSDLEDFLASPPGPGDVAMAADTVAVAAPAVDGGDAALLVTSAVSDVRGDALRTVAEKIVTQIG
jgi:hypothetical protein